MFKHILPWHTMYIYVAWCRLSIRNSEYIGSHNAYCFLTYNMPYYPIFSDCLHWGLCFINMSACIPYPYRTCISCCSYNKGSDILTLNVISSLNTESSKSSRRNFSEQFICIYTHWYKQRNISVYIHIRKLLAHYLLSLNIHLAEHHL